MTITRGKPLFSRSGIRALKPFGADGEILIEGSGGNREFVLSDPGIYSLQGDNQAGKSLLIKILVGVRPHGLHVEPSGGDAIVDGKNITIEHVADALKNGIVAVFQDDRLIPSMTVEEQLLMRHAMPSWQSVWHWAWELGNSAFLSSIIHFIRNQSSIANRWLRDFKPKEQYLHPADVVRERASALLAEYKFKDILYKYPRELSGGATAVARLVAAQLTPGIRVLFLDEAFGGVAPDEWPRLVDVVKAWQAQNEAAVVAVTHNVEERIRWSPRQQFVVAQRQLSVSEVHGRQLLHRGIPERQSAFPVFSLQDELPWHKDRAEQAIVLLDAGIVDQAPTKELLARLLRDTGKHPTVIEVAATESEKSLPKYVELVKEVVCQIRSKSLVLVVVGGGVTLNLGGLVAATLQRGRHPTVLVPTTIMSLADVAVGGKTGINLVCEDGRMLKHALGVYLNPAAVLVDKRYIGSLSEAERVRGLSECLKHGLLQSNSLFESVVQYLEAGVGDPDKSFDIAMETMQIKSRVLEADPWEESYGKLLLYGHLHAHSLERATGFGVPHGSAVYFGMVVDLALAGNRQLMERIAGIMRRHKDAIMSTITWPSDTDLEKAYGDDNYFAYSAYQAIEVSRVGQYTDPVGTPLVLRQFNWHQIKSAIAFAKAEVS